MEKMDSFHYRVLRVACRDYKAKKKRKVIDSQCKRSTPKMWSNYLTASTAIKIIRDHTPLGLMESLCLNVVAERRRQNLGHFFDDSRLVLGRHIFANRLCHLNTICEPWFRLPLSNDSIRVLLKKQFDFNFVNKK